MDRPQDPWTRRLLFAWMATLCMFAAFFAASQAIAAECQWARVCLSVLVPFDVAAAVLNLVCMLRVPPEEEGTTRA